MEREEIELSEHIVRHFVENYDGEHEDEDFIPDENLEYEYVDEFEHYKDMEKSYITQSVIIKRKSDNKYFKFNYHDSYYHGPFDWVTFPLKVKEVFSKQVTKTIYE